MIRGVAASGVWIAFLVGLSPGCSCPLSPDYKTLISGQYRVSRFDTDGGESDYALVISDDLESAVETFTRDGKVYRIEYKVAAPFRTTH